MSSRILQHINIEDLPRGLTLKQLVRIASSFGLELHFTLNDNSIEGRIKQSIKSGNWQRALKTLKF